MKAQITTMLIALAVLAGCTQQNENDYESHDQNEEHQHDPHEVKALQLNNGAKWKVNDEMKPGVEEAEMLLGNFMAGELSDFGELAGQLENLNKQLISSCTMEGESHEMLHEWLHPHMKLVEQLGNATSTEDAEVVIRELTKSFETYHRYFE